jgi:hypothetical protein
MRNPMPEIIIQPDRMMQTKQTKTSMPFPWQRRLQALAIAFQPVVNIHTGVCLG